MFARILATAVAPCLVLVLITSATADPAEDTREAAAFTQVERAYILGQMRLFLTSIQAISENLSAGKLDAVAEAAAARGMKRNANDPDFPKTLGPKLTPLWKQMGGGTRKGFDQIAEAAQQGEPKDKILGLMGETMKNCVACHQTYKLVAAPE